MERKADRLYPSEPFENKNLEHRQEKKLKDVHSFSSYISNIKKMNSDIRDEKQKSKKKYKN